MRRVNGTGDSGKIIVGRVNIKYIRGISRGCVNNISTVVLASYQECVLVC